MENFFGGSKYALYFIGLFFLIIQNRTDKEETNKNIILIYIIYSLTNIFGIINFGLNTLIVLSICLIEMQVLTLNEKESFLLIDTRYKFLDYAFTMVNKYKVVEVIILNVLFSFTKDIAQNSMLVAIFFAIILAILFFKTIGEIYLNKFRVKRLDKIEKEFIELSKGFVKGYEYKNFENKLQMLSDIEDKTFFLRMNSYTSLSLDALLYKCDKGSNVSEKIYELGQMTNKTKIEYMYQNRKKIISFLKHILKTIIKAIFKKDGIKRYIKRGYSTLEMQLIRQLGIETGYEKTYTRKFYEIIYTNIFFKSLDKKRIYNNYYEHRQDYKKRIAYVYLKKVPSFLNTDTVYKKCKNIYAFYKYVRAKEEQKEEDLKAENIVFALSMEELFIFILGLSGKYLCDNTLNLYRDCIDKYNLDENNIRKIILRIDNK